MPLRALLNEEPRLAWELTEEDRGLQFKCPICDDDMIIVLPQSHIIKHFRHVNEEAHGEPETREHLEMKLKLFHLFSGRAKLEQKIPIYNIHYRIADVVIDDFLVVECQCAPISIKEVRERNCDYASRGYRPLWLLGGKHYENLQTYNIEFGMNGEYRVQSIRAPDRYIGGMQDLLYFGDDVFYYCNISYKSRRGSGGECSTKGWFNHKKISATNIKKGIDELITRERGTWGPNSDYWSSIAEDPLMNFIERSIYFSKGDTIRSHYIYGYLMEYCDREMVEMPPREEVKKRLNHWPQGLHNGWGVYLAVKYEKCKGEHRKND